MEINKVETLLIQILENQSSMQSDIKELNSKVDRINTKVNELDSKVDKLDSKVNELDSKVDALKDQLTEFEAKTANYHIETLNSFTEVNESIDFLTHKENQTEKEVYNIKKKLQVIK